MAAASSAYHTCFKSAASLRRLMRGMVAMAYIGIANRSPWVVPSSKRNVELSFLSTAAKDGHTCLILWRAASLLRVLKALLASTWNTASVPSE